MTIRPFLSGQTFEPKAIRKMSLESGCDALGLRMTDDPATRLVAEKIIEMAQRGVRDVDTVRVMALKEFNHLRTKVQEIAA